MPLLASLTRFQAAHAKLKLPEESQALANEKERAALQKHFTPHLRQAFKQFETLAVEAGAELFCDLLREELCNLAVSVRMLDKKSEKALLFSHKTSLKQTLEALRPEEGDPDLNEDGDH